MLKNTVLSKIKKYSSRKWILRHMKDSYVKLSNEEGYRSRSAYKLIEINKKFHILNKHSNVLELGSFPGGWSQVLSQELIFKDSKSNIIAVDIKKMDSIHGVIFVHGDFLDIDIQNKIEELIKNFSSFRLNLILSDIAPNFSGNKHVDQLKMMNMFENIIKYALNMLTSKGNFVAKIFHSSIDDSLKYLLKKKFQQVKFFKPKSSRKESEEIYLVALGKK